MRGRGSGVDAEFLNWVALIAAAFTVLPVVWGAFHFITIKQAEERARQFTIYHGVIESLVEKGTYIDRQIASVYELRSYPLYYPATYRILQRLVVLWGASDEEKFQDLIKEMHLTLDFIRKSGKRYLE
jgi:hypothetical protein